MSAGPVDLPVFSLRYVKVLETWAKAAEAEGERLRELMRNTTCECGRYVFKPEDVHLGAYLDGADAPTQRDPDPARSPLWRPGL